MPKLKKKKLAIFDIDGTIFRRSLMVELMKSLVYYKIFPKEAADMVNREYHAWINRRSSYQLYIEKVVDVFNKMIKGCKKTDIENISKKVIAYYRDRNYVYVRDLIEKLREDYFLLSISGSPIEVVNEYNKYLKFDKIYGTIFEVSNDGKYTGKVILNGAQEKEKIFNNFLKENKFDLKESIGIGDTEYDVTFLKRVENPIAFNPNSNLVKIAQRDGWKIILEKKDIICEIENNKVNISRYKF